MNYELAKQLKDAGFPQNKWGGITVFDGLGNTEEHGAFCPTLEELIEACGDITLEMFKKEAEAWCSGKVGKGSTPTEAVARLWLALNKK